MRKKSLVLVSCLWLIAGLARAQATRTELAIAVNHACSLDNISSADLAKIFLAKKNKNPDGAKYLIGSREPGSPEREAALKAIYQMTDAEYEKYFLQATFAGTIQAAPKVLGNGAAVRQFVASSPGAIGYLRASEADASVKILKVDGKAPGDPDYPIKIEISPTAK